MNSRTQHGFTLTELMIVVVLAASILAIGAPSFQQFRLNNRLTNAANDLLAVITVARTEAIKRQRTVAACRSDNPTSEDAKCSTTSEAGWIVFDDADGNCVRGDSVTEPLLGARTFENSNATNPLRVKTDGDCLQFGASGFRRKVGTLTSLSHITLCDNRGLDGRPDQAISPGRGILITTTGRARITRVVDGASEENILSDTWKDAQCPPS
jgi:prepilin-type N-terminal cleavage/methylation domain-containing protein